MAENYSYKQDGSRSVSISELTKEELVQEVLRLRSKLKKKNAFGLVFERQTEDAILNRKATIPVLVENKKKLVNNGGEDNLLLIGDNLDSLTCLLETHRGKIDVIYIDPPYNTGSENFIYNDKYVNPEDSFRHSKWLSFMEARLSLSKELLSDNGVIFVSIDDNEQATLKMLMDSVFGASNFIDQIIWKKTENIKMDSKFLSQNKDFILTYRKSDALIEFTKEVSDEDRFKLEDDKGKYYLRKLDSLSSSYSKGMDYVIEHEGISYYAGGSKEKYDERQKGFKSKKGPTWLWSKSKFEQGVLDGEIVFKNGNVYNKVRFDGEAKKPFVNIQTIASGQTGQKELEAMFGYRSFDHPKPQLLMQWLVRLHPNKDGMVLDFFAGSGTTGQAVMELNKEDGGNRKFILCTNDEAGIGETVTYERIKRVITGKDWADGKEHESHEASLRYYNVQFIEREKAQSLITENVDGLINIAESCFNELYKGEMSSLWNNSRNHFTALLRDPWGVEELTHALSAYEPSTLTLYVHDNGADYSQELSYIESQGWDITYVSLNDFIFNVISFVDEKLNINLAETNTGDSNKAIIESADETFTNDGEETKENDEENN